MTQRSKIIAYLSACAVVVCALLLLGVTSGHFESMTERDVNLRAAPLYRLYLMPVEENGNWYEREFLLTNIDMSPTHEEAADVPEGETETNDDNSPDTAQDPAQSQEENQTAETVEEGDESGGDEENQTPDEETTGDEENQSPDEETTGDEENQSPDEEMNGEQNGEDPAEEDNEENPITDAPAQEDATPQSGNQSEGVPFLTQQELEAAQQRRIARLPEMSARVTLLASIGVGDINNISVTLRTDDREYAGKAHEIAPGSELYRRFGPGWQLFFLDEEEQELTWAFTAGQAKEYRFTVSVRSDHQILHPTLFQLNAVTLY